MINMRSDHVIYSSVYGQTVVEDIPPKDAVVDPIIEQLFALSNVASDRVASPIDMPSVLFAAFSRLDEESASSDSHAAMPTTAATPDKPADATKSESVDDLLSRARDGDSGAWEEIVRRYSSVVFATVRSFRLQDADVCDAVQMTWLRLAENVHQVQFPDRLAGWLATTARRECLHMLRQQAKQFPEPAEKVAENAIDPQVGPEQRVIEGDTARKLWKLVAELSPVRRTVLRALFADNPCPTAEAARAARIPPGAIGPTRKRALQQLRRRLNEQGLGPEI